MEKHLPVLQSYVNADLCGPCGGNCCKGMPGTTLPSDFGDSPEMILAALTERLATGRWAIDWWEGNPTTDGEYADIDRAYYIRPAIKGIDRLYHPAYGGACTFHGPNGCEIFEARPSGCKGLEPGPDGTCEVRHSSKQDSAIAWLPYHDLIMQTANGLR